MPSQPLKPDVTIRDVLPTLVDPEEFVRVIVGHLSQCFKQHQHATVRIGITGKGLYPSHKVVYDDSDGKETLFGAFAESLRFTENIGDSNWSTARMTYAEVRALMKEIQSIKRPARRA